MKKLLILFSCLVVYFCSYRVIDKGVEVWDNNIIEFDTTIETAKDIRELEYKIRTNREGRIPDKIILIFFKEL